MLLRRFTALVLFVLCMHCASTLLAQPVPYEEVIVDEGMADESLYWTPPYGPYEPNGPPIFGGPWMGWRGEAEFLLWIRDGMNLPPLVGTDVLGAGRTLFGNQEVFDDIQPGFRANLEYWFEAQPYTAVGIRYYALADEALRFDSRNTGEAQVTRPFFNVDAGVPDGLVVNGVVPAGGPIAGFVTVDVDTQFQGGDIYYRTLLAAEATHRFDLTLGYQTMLFKESLVIEHDFVDAALTRTQGVDRFETENEYHGFHLGVLGQYDGGQWELEGLFKIGLGSMRELVIVQGDQDVAPPPVTTLLTQDSNIGIYSQREFAATPEIGVKCIYHLTSNFDVTLGYSLLYLTRVVRPGDHIDLRVDEPPQAVLSALPGFAFAPTDFWMQGFNIGVVGRY